MHPPVEGAGSYAVIFAVQIGFLLVFAFFTDYKTELKPPVNGTITMPEDYLPKYPHFQDIHVMIFIGFAFLMTFLKKYGYSASGFNLLLAAFVVQWALIMRGIFEIEHGMIRLSLDGMIGADIAAAAVLISMGALLGRVTPLQLLAMGFFEIIFFASNEYLNIELFKITDIGGSITVHAFGAYFGLACSLVLRPSKEDAVAGEFEGPSYMSDITAMIGSIFLWIYWPSFNSALVEADQQERAILHTYLSLAACTVVTFLLSALVNHERKFDMVHIQNSTLAGGVAVGSIVNLLIHPFGAVLTGVIAAIVSVFGYKYLTPALFDKIRLADTCGVNNLHGMPALLSAILSAIYASLSTYEQYGQSLYDIFPAMKVASGLNQTGIVNHTLPGVGIDGGEDELEFVVGGFGRTAAKQGAFQLIGILVTLSIAIVGGLITGLILKVMRPLDRKNYHQDHPHWELEQPE